MKNLWAGILATVASVTFASASDAAVKAGVLKCNVEGGAAFIVGSSHAAECFYEGVNGYKERYEGRMNRIGLDVGFTGKAVMVWAVYAPTDYTPHALRGSYIGGSADASLGVGAGANILIGGNNRTISLQPLSTQAETGIDLGIGVGDLELR